MKIKVFHTRKNVFLLEFLVFILLSIVYQHIIKDAFSYMGFNGLLNVNKFVYGWLFFLLFTFLGSKITNEFIYAVWHICFLFFFVGQIIFYQYSDGSIRPVLANSIFLMVLFCTSFLRLRLPVISLKGKTLTLILTLSILLFFPIFIKYAQYINLKNLLLQEVYETRIFFREFNDKYFGYIRAPLSRVILPSLLIIGFIRKQIWLIVLSCFMITFIFLVGALKSIFFGMIMAIWFYIGKTYKKKVFLLLYLFFGLTFFGLMFFFIAQNVFLVDAPVRRILFIPPLIDNYYYSFFNDFKLVWSHNILGELLFEYPLDRPPNMYVGEILLEKKGMSANVGIVTEGYFSFGFIGVFMQSLFISMVFLFLKEVKLRPEFFGLVFVYIYYVNTSFLSVLILTHGLFFFLIFSYLFLNKDYERKDFTDFK